MKNEVMVSVLCTAYNHKGFIRDAIEGVLRQKTDFRVELIIHDDASTDGTAEIVKEYAKKYPKTIRIILQKENQFRQCRIYPRYLFPLVRGKYLAFCEGDDYWTDEYKLQKQIDFLENHPGYSMCMHNAIQWNYETGEKKRLDTFPKDGTYPQREQLMAGLGTDFPAFASYVLRSSFLEDIPDFFLASNVVDYPIRQYFAACGNVYYFQKPMSVYRVSTPQSYMKKTKESQSFYKNYTLEMIRFFEAFNQYTNREFQDILKCKISSDYLGFCVSTDEAEALRTAMERGLDAEKIQSCYRALDPKYLNTDIREMSAGTEELFIYGTSRLAPVCRKQLEHAGIEFKGYVVSDGQNRPDTIQGKQIFSLSEAFKRYKNPGFILAVQPINVNAIVNELEKYQITNYCIPYHLGGYQKGK